MSHSHHFEVTSSIFDHQFLYDIIEVSFSSLFLIQPLVLPRLLSLFPSSSNISRRIIAAILFFNLNIWIPTCEVSRSAILKSCAEKVTRVNLWPIVLCVWSLIRCLIKHVLTVWTFTSTSACLVNKQCLMMFGRQTFPVWTGLKLFFS